MEGLSNQFSNCFLVGMELYVEEHEALETGAIVGQLADAVEDEVDDLLADGVMSAGD